MERRTFLKAVGGTATGLTVGVDAAVAADSGLEPGTWYDATVTDAVDGDTFDVELDDGTAYTVRTLGIDTPEASGYTRYDRIEEWEGIEDESHLADWGDDASAFAADELPVGTECRIAVDGESEEIDRYDRLLAKIRYDRTGTGSMGTVYNRYALEEGYARVYSASMSDTDEYWDAENAARAEGVGLWAGSDPENTPEVRDDDVAETFHPNTSSVGTSDGAIPPSRVPVWAEAEATQTLGDGAVDYGDDPVPLVGVDEAANAALLGGQPIQEDHDADSEHLEHFVFLTNLVDHLTDGDRPGMVLVDGGHRQFEAGHACSCEDAVFYQRYLEGQGIELAGVNALDDAAGPSLADARAVLVTSPENAFTDAETTALREFVDDGGAVVLLGSSESTAAGRSNLDDLAAGLGSDLRLNSDAVTDDANNVGDADLLTTTAFNEADFQLWSAYSGDAASPSYVVSVDTVERNATTLNEEYVDLTNEDDADLDATGWTVENEEGRAYTFPDGFTLAAGETVRVHTGDGDDTDADLYWGAGTFRWDVDEDRCAVLDADGDLAADESWSVPDVIIPTVSESGDGLNDEWVEFGNVEGADVDMSGWTVEDEAGYDYRFPDGFTLADGDSVRLHTGDGDDTDTDLYWGSGSFVWNDGGDTAFLTDGEGNPVRDHTYPAPYDVSVTDMSLEEEWVDVTNGGSSILDTSGFTLEDEAGYTYTFPDSFGLGAGETVRIHTGEGEDTTTDLYWGMGIGVWNDGGDTAFVHDDNGRLADERSSDDLGDGSCDSTICVGEISESGGGLNDEWVEFDNTADSDRDMTGWAVEDEAGYRYEFPDDYTLTAGGTVRLHTGDGDDSGTDGNLYWGSGSYVWNDGGDTVYLYEPDGTLHAEKSY
ncbi:DUF4350 domain-containing protein [Halorarum salinum]|uniref:Lamin tail domain-containing protein n=1 Tax=Halorarum salinum TaxID=2743089 RepID=A0A7D5L8Y2_9EURY|nr:DUF4350 domain-containing protein [Halobaculum salinum]QLG60751.1 lamin tail domain-containing protein [Halobaculum salinum]